MNMKIVLVDYKLFDYEYRLLEEEIKRIGGTAKFKRHEKIVDIGSVKPERALELTFVKGVIINDEFRRSTQGLRESFNGNKKTQSRRYGPHGLHEYKGRYNPQMPRSLLMGNFDKGQTIIDPFMGSGTTLIEARGLKMSAIGVEMNPMAHLIARSKIFFEEVQRLPNIRLTSKSPRFVFNPQAKEYLLGWFPEKQFAALEKILSCIENLKPKEKVIAKVVLSNLLRDHSLQDPRDLRIRRRESVPSDSDLLESFSLSYGALQEKQHRWVKEFGISKTKLMPMLGDSRDVLSGLKQSIEGSVSSPPYASALPYIDTYRLSMIALDLITPNQITKMEKSLIGARDISSLDKENFESQLHSLPSFVQAIIKRIRKSVDSDDGAGFRKTAVPYSLAKYATSMRGVLQALYSVQRKGAKNFWVIGTNKVKLDNEWYFIKTPEIIGELAREVGFSKVEMTPVDAYVRYSLHSKNSINHETILRFDK